jgi:hypothetical protein
VYISGFRFPASGFSSPTIWLLAKNVIQTFLTLGPGVRRQVSGSSPSFGRQLTLSICFGYLNF